MQPGTPPAPTQLALAPLGAGDLIDRTIRLYRQHFLTLLRTAAPPVCVAAVGSVLWTVSVRAVPLAGTTPRLVFYVLCAAAGWLLAVSAPLCLLIILGGAARNLVMHLLWGEPVSARTIYRNVRLRFWALCGVTLLTGLCALMAGGLVVTLWLMAVGLTVAATAFALGAAGGAASAVVVLLTLVLYTLLALLLYFWLLGHLAYVPQVLLIEGRGVAASFSRSIALARGNVRRLLAMYLFTTFATYSALMLLLIPLGWYGYLHGINPADLTHTDWPIWYAIGYQVIWQLSSILLMPVWMLGLSLLYVDERVRHEGYDIELLAAQRLGAMPQLPDGRSAPLAPALAGGPLQATR